MIQTRRSEPEPIIDGGRNPIQKLGRIAFATIYRQARFDVQRGDTTSSEVCRSNICRLASVRAPNMKSFWMIISLSIAHYAEKRSLSRNAEHRHKALDIFTDRA